MSRKFLKLYPELSDLDKFSRRFAERLFNVFPHWVACAHVEDKGQFLIVEVSAPVAPSERDLTVSTDAWRITIGFDVHHVHVYRFSQLTDSECIARGIEFVHSILAENLIAGVRVNKEGRETYSKFYSPDMLSGIQPGDVSYTCSWLGTYSRSYK
jgi:hypothetical protein